VLYPIGVPAFFFWLMWRYRKRLAEPGVRLQLGFLYAGAKISLGLFVF